MRKLQLITCLLTYSLLSNSLLYAPNVLAQSASAAVPAKPDTGPANWLAQFQAVHEAGTTILLSQRDKVLQQETLGMASLELAVPLQARHLFRIGSISKTFLAVLTLQLAEQGKLDLNQAIHHYLPDIPASWQHISTAHLLSHTSGIADYLGGPQGGYSSLRGRRLSKDELIRLFYGWPLQFQAGQQFIYSNSGYVVLMKLVETVSGKSFAELLAQNITQPLQMHATYAQAQGEYIAGLVSGYTSSTQATYLSQLDGAFADGSMVSSSADLLKFAQALLDGRLLSAASWQLMSTPYRFNDGTYSEYGYGLFIRDSQGHKLVGHGGDIFGFHSMLEIDTDTQAIAIVLRNSDQFGARRLVNADYLSRRMLARANHRPINEPQAIELSPAQIQALLGDYPTPQGVRSVRYHQGELLTRLNQGRESRVLAASATDLFAPHQELRLHFTMQHGRAVAVEAHEDQGQP